MSWTCPGKLPGPGDGIRLGLGAGSDSSLGLALGRGGGSSISRELQLGDLELGPGSVRAVLASPHPLLRGARLLCEWHRGGLQAPSLSFLGSGVVSLHYPKHSALLGNVAEQPPHHCLLL